MNYPSMNELPKVLGAVDLDGVTHLCLAERDVHHEWNDVVQGYVPAGECITVTPNCWHWLPVFTVFEPHEFVETRAVSCLWCLAVDMLPQWSVNTEVVGLATPVVL